VTTPQQVLQISAGSAFGGARWSAIGRLADQAARFVTFFLLARLLAPQDFGLMAVALVVMGFLDLVRDGGTGQALIQRPLLEEGLASSVFFLNVGLGFLVAIGLALLAGPISVLYGNPDVAPLLRVLALGFLVSSWAVTPRALLIRAIRFRNVATSDLSGTFAYATVAISLALSGFGVWALVLGAVAADVASTAMFWWVSEWRPRLHFSRAEIRSIRSFSMNLSVYNVINYFLNNTDTLVISRVLGAVSLGYYSVTRRILVLPIMMMVSVMTGVLLPALARVQTDEERFRRDYLRACSGIALVAFPVAAGIGVVARPFVEGFLGAKWQPAIPIIELYAPIALLIATMYSASSIYRAKGRTDWLLMWGLLSGLSSVAAYVVGVHWGLEGLVGAYGIAVLLLFYPSYRIPFSLTTLSFSDVLIALRPYAAGTLLMALVAVGLRLLLAGWGLGPRIVCLAASAGGALTYGGFMLWMRPPALSDLLRLVFPQYEGSAARPASSV
jgi:PST family polysaccharide transporter